MGRFDQSLFPSRSNCNRNCIHSLKQFWSWEQRELLNTSESRTKQQTDCQVHFQERPLLRSDGKELACGDHLLPPGLKSEESKVAMAGDESDGNAVAFTFSAPIGLEIGISHRMMHTPQACSSFISRAKILAVDSWSSLCSNWICSFDLSLSLSLSLWHTHTHTHTFTRSSLALAGHDSLSPPFCYLTCPVVLLLYHSDSFVLVLEESTNFGPSRSFQIVCFVIFV